MFGSSTEFEFDFGVRCSEWIFAHGLAFGKFGGRRLVDRQESGALRWQVRAFELQSVRSACGGELEAGKFEGERAGKLAKVYAGKLPNPWAGMCICGGDALSSGSASDWPGVLRVRCEAQCLLALCAQLARAGVWQPHGTGRFEWPFPEHLLICCAILGVSPFSV